jgi:hypothetical protein
MGMAKTIDIKNIMMMMVLVESAVAFNFFLPQHFYWNIKEWKLLKRIFQKNNSTSTSTVLSVHSYKQYR